MKRVLFTILTTICISTSFAQQKLTFKLNPELNKPINYELLTKMDITSEQSILMDMSLKFDMTATSSTDSSFTIESKYKQIIMDMTTGTMTMNYDSSKEPEGMIEQTMAQQFKPLLENTLVMEYNKEGKVISFDFPNVPAGLMDVNQMKNLSLEYPNKSLAIGDSWSVDTEAPALNALFNTTYTFVEKTAEGYKINISGKGTDDAGNEIGSIKGYTIINPKTFMTAHSQTETTIEVQGAKVVTSSEIKAL